MSHTPGPWDGWYAPNGPDAHAWAIGPEGCVPCVATVGADENGGLSDGATIEANARLIAAAPQMLTVLRRLVALGEDDGSAPARAWKSAFADAATLIARAEGLS